MQTVTGPVKCVFAHQNERNTWKTSAYYGIILNGEDRHPRWGENRRKRTGKWAWKSERQVEEALKIVLTQEKKTSIRLETANVYTVLIVFLKQFSQKWLCKREVDARGYGAFYKLYKNVTQFNTLIYRQIYLYGIAIKCGLAGALYTF